jgi:hypothetical protein
MNLNWIFTLLTVAQLATPAPHPAPKPWVPTDLVTLDESGCWVAECFLDGYTLHWQETFSTYQEAEAARAEHVRNDDTGRHQAIVDTCN